MLPQKGGAAEDCKAAIRTATVLAALSSAAAAEAKAIVVFSARGDFARLISKGTDHHAHVSLTPPPLTGRPNCPIIVVTHAPDVASQVNMFYGCYPVVLPLREYTDPTVRSSSIIRVHLVLTRRFLQIAHAETAILDRGWLKAGDLVVLCSGASQLPGLAYSSRLYHFGAFVGNYAARLFKGSPHPGHRKDDN